MALVTVAGRDPTEMDPAGAAGFSYDPSTLAQFSDGRWYALDANGGLQLVAESADFGRNMGLTPGPNAAATLQQASARKSQQGGSWNPIGDFAKVLGPMAAAAFGGNAIAGMLGAGTTAGTAIGAANTGGDMMWGSAMPAGTMGVDTGVATGAAAADQTASQLAQGGSDWATGQATGPTAGLLPTDSAGLTLPNLEAASGVPGAVNSGLDSFGNPGGGASGASPWGGLGSLAGGLAAINYANNLTSPDMSPLQNAVSAYDASNPNAYSLQAYNTVAGSNPTAYSTQAYNTAAGSDPTAALRSALSQAQVNSPLYVQAAQSPLLQSQAAGYGQMLQGQANRGIYGSSFGNNDIGNYMSNTNTGIANAGINAAQSAIGLQGQIGQNIGSLTNQQNATLGNIGANIGSLTNQQNATLGNIGGNMASATNQNLAGQTTAANDYITQLINAQANKTNLIGRALGGIGNGLNSPSGVALGNTITGGLGALGGGLSSLYNTLFGGA